MLAYSKNFRLMMYLIYVVHVLSCFWILLGFLWDKNGNSWFITAGIPPASFNGTREDYLQEFYSIGPVYIRAVYFIVTSLTTVGYGDIRGITDYELLF
jgi:Ion channel